MIFDKLNQPSNYINWDDFRNYQECLFLLKTIKMVGIETNNNALVKEAKLQIANLTCPNIENVIKSKTKFYGGNAQ